MFADNLGVLISCDHLIQICLLKMIKITSTISAKSLGNVRYFRHFVKHRDICDVYGGSRDRRPPLLGAIVMAKSHPSTTLISRSLQFFIGSTMMILTSTYLRLSRLPMLLLLLFREATCTTDRLGLLRLKRGRRSNIHGRSCFKIIRSSIETIISLALTSGT